MLYQVNKIKICQKHPHWNPYAELVAHQLIDMREENMRSAAAVNETGRHPGLVG